VEVFSGISQIKIVQEMLLWKASKVAHFVGEEEEEEGKESWVKLRLWAEEVGKEDQ
jgi:hypothetical protein